MKLSKTQMVHILSPVPAPPETFISFPVEAALAKDGSLDTSVATSFVSPPKYWDWKRCLNRSISKKPQHECQDILRALAHTNRYYSKKRRRKKL